MLVVGSIHGNETQGERVVRRLRHHYAGRLDGVALWTIATVNPDGVAADSRGNAHGVDLNRNFAADWRPIPPSSGYYSGPHPSRSPRREGGAQVHPPDPPRRSPSGITSRSATR